MSQSRSNINLAQSILEIAASFRVKLYKPSDLAKLEMAIYAVEEFTLYKENDFFEKNNRRAEQVVHAYRLIESLFNKKLRNTDCHTEGKVLKTLMQEYANQAIKQKHLVLMELSGDLQEDMPSEEIDNDLSSTEVLEVAQSDELDWVDVPTLEDDKDATIRFIESFSEEAEQSTLATPPNQALSNSAFFRTPKTQRPPTPFNSSFGSSGATEENHPSDQSSHSDEPALPREMERANAIIGFRN